MALASDASNTTPTTTLDNPPFPVGCFSFYPFDYLKMNDMQQIENKLLKLDITLSDYSGSK